MIGILDSVKILNILSKKLKELSLDDCEIFVLDKKGFDMSISLVKEDLGTVLEINIIDGDDLRVMGLEGTEDNYEITDEDDVIKFQDSLEKLIRYNCVSKQVDLIFAKDDSPSVENMKQKVKKINSILKIKFDEIKSN